MDRVKLGDLFQRLCDLSVERFPQWAMKKCHREILAVEIPTEDLSEAIVHFAGVGQTYSVPLAILAVDVPALTDEDQRRLCQFNESNEFDNGIVHINTLQLGCRSQMFIQNIVHKGGFVLLLTTPSTIGDGKVFESYCKSLEEVLDKKLLPMPEEETTKGETAPLPS